MEPFEEEAGSRMGTFGHHGPTMSELHRWRHPHVQWFCPPYVGNSNGKFYEILGCSVSSMFFFAGGCFHELVGMENSMYLHLNSLAVLEMLMKSPCVFFAVGRILFALASLPTFRKVCLHVFFFADLSWFDTNLPYLMVCSVVPILIYLFLSCVLPIFTNFRMLFIHVFHVCSTICPHVPTVNTFNTHSFSHTFPQTSFIIPCVNHMLEVSINVGYPKNRCFFFTYFYRKNPMKSVDDHWGLQLRRWKMRSCQRRFIRLSIRWESVGESMESMEDVRWLQMVLKYGFLYSCYMVSVGFYMFFFFNGFVRFIYNYIWF